MLWAVLFATVVVAQPAPDTLLIPNANNLGASWGANGGYATFGMAGQYAQGAISGGNYTGRIGYLMGDLGQADENLPPVAISPDVQYTYEIGDVNTLLGYDPEGQPINYVITRLPEFGIIEQDAVKDEEWTFSPDTGLQPDVVYEDTLKFEIQEVNTGLTSETATVAFKFRLEDSAHEVTDLTKSSNSFEISFEDDLLNASYIMVVNYYDLTDPANPEQVNVLNSTINLEDIEVDGTAATYAFTVNQNTHDYLFSSDQVLMTVLITTANGYSSTDSFVISNGAEARILADDDGEYFVLGSEMSVPENKSTFVKMVAVDFAGFNSAPSLTWTSNPKKGILEGLNLVKSSSNIYVWEAKYISNSDDGENDAFGFSVYNPYRNSYKSADINMTVQAVNDLPTLSDIADQQLNEGASKMVSLNYSDPDNELTVQASSNNQDIVAEIVDGNLALSTTDDYYGSGLVNVWVKEIGTEEEYLILKQLSVEVLPVNDSPVLAAIANQTEVEDQAISVPLVATDVDSDFVLLSYYGSIDNPILASLEFSGNTLVINPKANAFGTATVTVVADDGSGTGNALSNTVSFDVEFTAINDDPMVIQSLQNQQLVENFLDYTINLSRYFSDAETLSGDLTYGTSGNTNIGVNINGDIATISSFTEDYSGTETISFTASDGQGGTDATIVADFVVAAESVEIAENTALGAIVLDEDFGEYTLDVSTVFTSAETLTYQLIGNNLASAEIDDTNQEVVFSSIDDLNGDENLFLIASANGFSKLHSFQLSITPINDAPIIEQIDDQSVNEDATLSHVAIEVYDPDGDAITSFDAVSSDQSLVLDENITIIQNGDYYILSLTPEDDQNGMATITATASDGTDNSEMTFEFTVVAVNDAPTVIGALSDLDEDGSFSVDITTLFEDVDSESLTYEVESLPEWADQIGTTLSGTPANDDVGINEITILVSDEGNSIRSTFEFEIINVNDAPIRIQEAGSQTVFVSQSFSYDFPEGHFEDEDVDDELTFVVERKPDWLTETNGTISGKPTESEEGSYKVIFKATDNSGEFARDTLYLDVEVQSYEVTISFAKISNCEGEVSSVQASGAFDYNWYNESNELVQAGGDTYESTTAINLFVEGVDSQDIATESKSETSITTFEIPDVTISQNGDLVSVSENNNYIYEWFLDDVGIDDTNTSTYEPSESGLYKVTVTSDKGCTATSSAIDISILGWSGLDEEVRLYPVPVKSELIIEVPGGWEESLLRIVSLQGQVLYKDEHLRTRQTKIDLSNLNNGFYILTLSKGSLHARFKFYKQ